MIVFRIEHRDEPKRGGFRPHTHGHYWDRLPSPAADDGIGRYLGKGEVCAALPEKFSYWWPPEGELLVYAEASGYHAVALEVPDEVATVGVYQVVFPRDQATVVGRVSLSPAGKWVM